MRAKPHPSYLLFVSQMIYLTIGNVDGNLGGDWTDE